MQFFAHVINTIQSALNSRHRLGRAVGALALTALSDAALAQVGGLTKTKTALELLREQMYIILPIVAIIIGVIIAVLYSAEIMRKDDVVRWGTGVVVAGSIAELVALLWK